MLRTQGQLTTRFGYDKLGRKTWRDTTRQDTHEQVLRKEWEYDRAGELVRKVHSRSGETRYRYDTLGRIVSASGPAGNEFFEWDAAANLVDTAQVGGYVKYNRVTVYQDKRYEYDVHGRMQTKRIGRHTEQDFRYDGEHRLREVHTTRNGVHQVVYFDYDALGRRIRKRDAFGETLFLWDGLQMIQEQRGGNVATYLYEPGTYVPLARIELLLSQDTLFSSTTIKTDLPVYENNKLVYFHNELSGTPEDLTTDLGELIWHGKSKVWGKSEATYCFEVKRTDAPQDSKRLTQNLCSEGQYVDPETGLVYNTYRYYDPDIGRFTTSDPIGFSGGTNFYQYAPNPTGWTDPLGLAGVPGLIRYKPRPELTAQLGGRQTGIARAWAQEKQLILETGSGTRNWSPQEIDLITKTPNGRLTSVMSQAGYIGHHIKSVEGNGALGKKWEGDPRNIVFLENHDHPNSRNGVGAYNEHFHSKQGHRGVTTNSTRGRLIDRKAMMGCK